MTSFNYNEKYKISALPCKTDGILDKKLMEPLNFRSGTSIAIIGKAGSGKSNLLFSLFQSNAVNKDTKEKMNFRNVFDRIIIVSPSLKSMTKHCFEGDEENLYKFESLGEFLDAYEDILTENDENDKFETCVILDDIGSQIRTADEQRFNHFIHNRRHRRVCVFSLLQQFSMIAPQIRDSLNILITFYPQGIVERERIFAYTAINKKHMTSFYNEIFTKKYDSILIDLTLRNANTFKFYKNLFNPIEIKVPPMI